MKNSKLKRTFAMLTSSCILASALPLCACIRKANAESAYLAGDADESGDINIADAVAVISYVANPVMYPLTEQGAENGDVNQKGDGISSADAISIQKYLLGSITSLPESVMGEVTTEPASDAAYIHLKNTAIETEGNNLTVNGTTVTISASGEYYIDGTLDDGQIIVNVPDETVDTGTVKIFLDGVNITGGAAPAIYVANAENTSINLVEGTTNVLSDGTAAYEGDYLENGVIEAKDDMTVKGSGTLEINAANQYAIACSNDLKFNGGTINITAAASDAVRGKTSVTVKDGKLNIDSAGDGIKSTKGNVTIEGGVIGIKASNDAVQAETTIDISGGIITASGDRGLTAVTGTNITGGTVTATATDNQAELVTASQGTMLLNCADDTSQTDGCWKKANAIKVSDTLTASPLKKYKYVLISDASIQNGSSYNLSNVNTGAAITHTNDTMTAFSLTSSVTVFDTVNPGGTSGSTTEPVAGEYTITLSDSGISTNADSSSAAVADNICTITQPGIFAVSGDMTEGQIVVNVDKTAYPDGVVELDLMGVNLSNTTDSPIYVASIDDEVQIVAKKDTENTISDGTSYTNADGKMGAIYSCDDLKIKGTGSLTVNGNCEDAVVCKNDLKIYNGNITVNAVDDAVRGKDSVTIGNDTDTDFSTLNLTVESASGDGIKSTATDTATADKSYGVVTINGGTVNINTFGDGIQGEQDVIINGGDLTVYTYQGSSYTGSGSSSGSSNPWGGGGMSEGNSNKIPDDLSAKGIKAVGLYDETGTTYQSGGNITINGGNIDVDSSDDCIHAGGNIDLAGGVLTLASADDGVHSDNALTIGNGSGTYDDLTVVMSTCYEGMEGMTITQNSGSVIVNSIDDGYNAAGGADGSGSITPGGWGGNMGGNMSSSSSNAMDLKGGFVIVNATDGDHDGFDSNGNLNISGGIVISNGNEAFDCGDGYSISYTGGVYVKNTGAGGMGGGMPGGMGGMGGSSNLTQSVSASGSVSAGTRITLTDGSGKVIVSFIADKTVSSVIAGCTEYSGSAVYTGGTLENSTYFQTIDDTQLAAYGGTLSGGTELSSGSSSGYNEWNW